MAVRMCFSSIKCASSFLAKNNDGNYCALKQKNLNFSLNNCNPFYVEYITRKYFNFCRKFIKYNRNILVHKTLSNKIHVGKNLLYSIRTFYANVFI